MRAGVASADRGTIVRSTLLLGSAGALLASVAAGPETIKIAAPLAALLALGTVAFRKPVIAWRHLLAAVFLVILFIPIRRYDMPIHLPFQLEPYRLLVALVTLGWFASLLVDPRVRLRRSGLDAPILLVAFGTFASVVVNAQRVDSLQVQTYVAKSLTFFVSFMIVFYLIVSVVKTRDDLTFLVKVLVGGGAVLALFAFFESVTRINVFNDLGNVLPLKPDIPWTLLHADQRGGRLRVYASAENPIALSAGLVMLTPLAIYLHKVTQQRRWTIAGIALAFGAIATVSRTGIVMFVVIGFVFVRLRPRAIKRLWPALLPALLAVHLALPGAIGSFQGAFFPKGGIVAEQSAGNGSTGSGRLAHVGPGIAEWSGSPIFGEGYGTRVIEKAYLDQAHANAPILDDEWLGVLLETGAVGIFAWLWVFRRFVVRLYRRAREDHSPTGWLAGGLSASIAAYAVAMFTFDAFSFAQVTLLLFIVLALGAVLLRLTADEQPEAAPAAAHAPSARGAVPAAS